MPNAPFLLFFALGGDLDAQADPRWRSRNPALQRINGFPGQYVPVAITRLKHPDANVRVVAEKLVGQYRQWYRNPLTELGGGDYPWIDMIEPSRFHHLKDEEPPVFFGIPTEDRDTAWGITVYYLREHPHQGDKDNGPHWGNYRGATQDYVRDLFKAGCSREQTVTMLRRMRQLEVLYLERTWKK